MVVVVNKQSKFRSQYIKKENIFIINYYYYYYKKNMLLRLVEIETLQKKNCFNQ